MESHQYDVVCSSCEMDLDRSDDFEYWLWHSHFLAEVHKDLQLLMHRKGGRTSWVEGMLISVEGEATKISPLMVPTSEGDFHLQAGCYFSLRQYWKDFLKQHWPIGKFNASKISDGYYLIVNPPVETDDDLNTFKDNCVNIVANGVEAKSEVNGHYEFADLSWADSWQFQENTYHQWLSDYEADLESSELIAGVLASPQKFFEILESELSDLSCELRRESKNGTVVFLGDQEYYLSFDYREFLLNAMIKGYNFWGALRFVEPVLDSWEQARTIGERLKETLTNYQCTVYGGRYFQCRTKRGKIVKEFDLLSLEDMEEELESEGEFLRWIAPQIELDPSSKRFTAA